MRHRFLIASLVLCLLGVVAGESLAYTGIGTNWRTEYPAACALLQDATRSTQSCVLCHTAGDGLNGYGSDLAQANLNFAAIEGNDSDGDGRTNLQEILDDCTLPGDNLSVPADQDTWTAVKALFR